MSENSRFVKTRSNSLFPLRNSPSEPDANFKTKFKDELRSFNEKSTNIKEDVDLDFGDNFVDVVDENQITDQTYKDVTILKQAYYSLLCAILDPTAHMREMHSFQLKSFAKITLCDECHSVLWGIHKQGFHCQKCGMNIHEKCQELVQEDCAQQRLKNLKSVGNQLSSRSVTNSPSFLQPALDTRYDDIRRAYPSYFTKLSNLFARHIHVNTKNDIKKVQSDYLNKSVKQMKTKLKIFVKSATNLIAKDACGTSDPYVTIQCGFSRIKRTKTQKKNLNPVWNETIEFEYYNTADGISGDLADGGDKLLIRLWDEDVGLKAQLDKMLTKEADDFLGQIILDINDLYLNGEQSYNLKPRSDGHLVTGFITLSITSASYEIFNGEIASLNSNENKEVKSSYIDQYRCLHRHIFYSIKQEKQLHNPPKSTSTWLFECMMPNFKESKHKLVYFKDHELSLILKQFGNKYVINETQKQMIHLECFYSFFIDNLLSRNVQVKKLESVSREENCEIFEFMHHILTQISSVQSTNQKSQSDYEADLKNINSLHNPSVNTFIMPKNFHQPDININVNNFQFLHETCLIPNKLIILLSNYRQCYSVRLLKNGHLDPCFEKENFQTIKEMQETVSFFSLCCNFIEKHLLLNNPNNNNSKLNSSYLLNEKTFLSLFDLSDLRKFNSNSIDLIKLTGYSKTTQFETILKCIEVSLITNLNYFLFEDDFNLNEEEAQQTKPSNIESNKFRNRHLSLKTSSKQNLQKKIDSFQHKQNTEISFFNVQFLMRKIESLNLILANKLQAEIELNETVYSSAFQLYHGLFAKNCAFKLVVKRVLVKEFLFHLIETIKVSHEIINQLRSEQVKLHLKLYLVLQRFLIDNSLDKFTLSQLLTYSFLNNEKLKQQKQQKTENDCLKSLNEMFQPFLLEFIKDQEDQFIKYMHKIYNMDNINALAEEISNAIDANRASLNSKKDANLIDLKSLKKLTDLENYYSPAVTDLFTILHELLQTVLQFDTKNSDLNLPHQLCFVNLIKNKLLTYAAHVKNEFHKVYRNLESVSAANSTTTANADNVGSVKNKKFMLFGKKMADNAQSSIGPSLELTIFSCILMNNFEKTIELLDEIQLKLTNKSKLKQSVLDQLESIKVILKEDLNSMIGEYSLEYKTALSNACHFIQTQLYDNDLIRKFKTTSATTNATNHLIDHLIDETLYDILNDKFMICKTVLFDSIFKRLLNEIFKIAVSCIEDSIILNSDSKFNFEFANCNLSKTSDNNDLRLNDSFQKSKKNDLFKKMFHIFDYSSKLNSNCDNQVLINDQQYKTISQGIKHIIDFFSADEDCLNKQYLMETAECQSAFRTLDLYLNSSSDLMSKFIQSQNMNQNNIDFKKSFGKIRFSVECRQNFRLNNEFDFTMRVFEIREFLPARNNFDLESVKSWPILNSEQSEPCVELNLLGPHSKTNKKTLKCVKVDLIKNSYVFNSEDLFEFKIVAKRDKLMNRRNLFDDYEIELVVYDSKSPKEMRLVGLCVFNLSIAIKSSETWKKLIKEENLWDEFKKLKNLNENGLYGAVELWLSLRPRLKINEHGNKILKVLDRHLNDKCAVQFIQLKLLSRGGKIF